MIQHEHAVKFDFHTGRGRLISPTCHFYYPYEAVPSPLRARRRRCELVRARQRAGLARARVGELVAAEVAAHSAVVGAACPELTAHRLGYAGRRVPEPGGGRPGQFK